MKTYKNKGTVKAVRWFKYGDHPAVKPLDKSSDDRILAEEGVAGYVEQECDCIRFVFPGDYIVETASGKITAFSQEEFESTYGEV